MKLTKIVSTLGPTTESEEQIGKLLSAGVNVFRLNMKHNKTDWHRGMIDKIRGVSAQREMTVGVLLDLQGPEIRLLLPNEQPIELTAGERVPLVKSLEGEGKLISVTHPDVLDHLDEQQPVLADDGLFVFKFVREEGQTFLESQTTGTLKHRKTMNFPGADFPLPVLTDRDYEGIDLAAEKQVEYVALSFVRTAADVETLTKELRSRNCSSMVLAKIENQKAIDNLDEVMRASEAVMVARGDLGVELPYEQVPYYTRLILKKSLEMNIPVITATQMLESMIENPLATRAEVSDVASAIYEHTDAIMLSGETAFGKHPIAAVTVMTRTAKFTEKKLNQDLRQFFTFQREHQTQMLADAAYNLYREMHWRDQDLQGFIVFTESGFSAKVLSNYKPALPIFALCPDEIACRKLTLYHGVFPFLFETSVLPDNPVEGQQVNMGIEMLEEKNLVAKGQKFIVMHGDYWAQLGKTSTVKIVKV